MYYSKFFVKYGLQDNNRFRNLVMKPIDAVDFQK